MNPDAHARPSTNAEAEEAARHRLIERLADEYPQAPVAAIAQSVDVAYRQYEQSPIRDFIPILVERSVKSEFAGYPARHRA